MLPRFRRTPRLKRLLRSSVRNIYLDNNATTRPLPSVVEAVHEALSDLWANPSSIHRAGQRVRQRVELARESIARLIGASPREIVFTSGGTESTNLAIAGSLHTSPGRGVVVTDRLEHSATRDLAASLAERSTEVIWLPLDHRGRVDAAALEVLLSQRAGEIAVVSVQWANNETGAVQPVREIGEACRRHGVRFHCDGTQWVGRMPTNIADAPIDLMTFSAHKFHGPKGVGALYVRRGVRISRQIIGGPQEREMRGGTENVPGILGFGAAAEAARAWLAGGSASIDAVRALRDRFERMVLQRVPDAVVNAAGAERLWNTSNIAFPRLEAEAILLLLSERGVYASAGAACSSGSLDPSPVLLAMGVPPELAHGSIRFSISRETTAEELDEAVDVIAASIARLRSNLAAV